MTGPAADSGLEYVGFWARFVAFLIDSLLALLVISPLSALLPGNSSSQFTELLSAGDLQSAISLQQIDIVPGPAEFVISYLLPLVAAVLFCLARQATPGKMAIGARIVDARTGGKPTLGPLIVRYLGYYVSIVVFFLGFVWIGLDSRKQGWHDKLAGTVVVRRKKDLTVKFGPPGN
ncbi:RDD family protein [Hydrocarboniphaga sp.]|uniref:RDD family protein n=1 Tax=Hydrocarboniphaga sp. TaxID=2033016 RepID=UPI003D1271DE